MLNNDIPLTAEESVFAAEHHDLIERYLKKDHLPMDEFYDIAVFGYLRAVHDHLAGAEPRQQDFSSCAEQAMRCDVLASCEYRKHLSRKRRRAAYNAVLNTMDSSCRILNFPTPYTALLPKAG